MPIAPKATPPIHPLIAKAFRGFCLLVAPGYDGDVMLFVPLSVYRKYQDKMAGIISYGACEDDFGEQHQYDFSKCKIFTDHQQMLKAYLEVLESGYEYDQGNSLERVMEGLTKIDLYTAHRRICEQVTVEPVPVIFVGGKIVGFAPKNN